MEGEIINKVASSGLITLDLEEWYPNEVFSNIDVSQWLFEGILLREKDFRKHLKDHDWTQYHDKIVLLNCSEDAILPQWTYLLVQVYLTGIAKKVFIGNKEKAIESYYDDYIRNMDVAQYKDERVIIKGCSRKPVPQQAYINLINKLQPEVKSLMFGEACSTVPLYKKK